MLWRSRRSREERLREFRGVSRGIGRRRGDELQRVSLGRHDCREGRVAPRVGARGQRREPRLAFAERRRIGFETRVNVDRARGVGRAVERPANRELRRRRGEAAEHRKVLARVRAGVAVAAVVERDAVAGEIDSESAVASDRIAADRLAGVVAQANAAAHVVRDRVELNRARGHCRVAADVDSPAAVVRDHVAGVFLADHERAVADAADAVAAVRERHQSAEIVRDDADAVRGDDAAIRDHAVASVAGDEIAGAGDRTAEDRVLGGDHAHAGAVRDRRVAERVHADDVALDVNDARRVDEDAFVRVAADAVAFAGDRAADAQVGDVGDVENADADSVRHRARDLGIRADDVALDQLVESFDDDDADAVVGDEVLHDDVVADAADDDALHVAKIGIGEALGSRADVIALDVIVARRLGDDDAGERRRDDVARGVVRASDRIVAAVLDRDAGIHVRKPHRAAGVDAEVIAGDRVVERAVVDENTGTVAADDVAVARREAADQISRRAHHDADLIHRQRAGVRAEDVGGDVDAARAEDADRGEIGPADAADLEIANLRAVGAAVEHESVAGAGEAIEDHRRLRPADGLRRAVEDERRRDHERREKVDQHAVGRRDAEVDLVETGMRVGVENRLPQRAGTGVVRRRDEVHIRAGDGGQRDQEQQREHSTHEHLAHNNTCGRHAARELGRRSGRLRNQMVACHHATRRLHMPDRIEKRILLRAPRERVWRAISDKTEYGEWFKVKFPPGKFTPGEHVTGHILEPGYEHLTLEIWIVDVIPETTLSFRWHPYGIDPNYDYSSEPTTLVTFTLEDADGGTRLTIVETGFDQIPLHRRDEAFRMNTGGWEEQSKRIERYVTAIG